MLTWICAPSALFHITSMQQPPSRAGSPRAAHPGTRVEEYSSVNVSAMLGIAEVVTELYRRGVLAPSFIISHFEVSQYSLPFVCIICKCRRCFRDLNSFTLYSVGRTFRSKVHICSRRALSDGPKELRFELSFWSNTTVTARKRGQP
jgi:hypothetical protein